VVTQRAIAALLGIGLGLYSAACTDGTYVIGAVCGAVGTCPLAGDGALGGSEAGGAGGSGGSGGSSASGGAAPQGGFTLDLTGSGVDRLPQALLGEMPTHFLVSSDAVAKAWPARVGDGFDVVGASGLTLAEPWPFADRGRALTHADVVAFSADSAWADNASGAVAFEAVFRAEPGAVLLAQQDADRGLSLSLDAQGRLGLAMTAAGSSLSVASVPLVRDAWHHCLALVDASEGAQIICNGEAGDAVVTPSALQLMDVVAPATLGSNETARVHWAELARWQSHSWGPRGAWVDAARERFARLVGAYAEGANAPLPFAEGRATGAYLDMTPVDAPEERRLHPVGEHWPRIVCRPTGENPRFCGLLLEASSSRPYAAGAFALERWNTSQLALAAAPGSGSTGDASLFALIPSTTAAQHALAFDLDFADGPAVLSFYGRAKARKLLRLDVVPGIASVTFDLSRALVTDAIGTRQASAEPWGNGLVRLSCSFDVALSPGSLRLTVLDDAGGTSFAGDGDVAMELGDSELRYRSFSTPLPTFGAIQAVDSLVFPSGNGNFPSGGAFRIEADFWLPDAPLLADSAILNANFASQYDQQISLFVTGNQRVVRFESLLGNAHPWNITSRTPVTDGRLHYLAASVRDGQATLQVDGASVADQATPYDTSMLDRIEVGASKISGGVLTGILRQLSIKAP
jgi:hypothetical protein